MRIQQLVSYIAPGAPATRRPASGGEAFLRPEIGFTPRWYSQSIGLSFDEAWHCDPAQRRRGFLAMGAELDRRFPGAHIGSLGRVREPMDLLTGVFGACVVAGIYGVPILYSPNDWPDTSHEYLIGEAVDSLKPPDLERNPFFQSLMAQMDWIGAHEGIVAGFLNWQGLLNNAWRLRGMDIFVDMMDHPQRVHHLFECLCATMIDACHRVQEKQSASGFATGFFTVSNCLVNMIAPDQYLEFVFPYDRRIAEAFGCLGVHNCAWSATPYLRAYAQLPHVAYVDMGIKSDLAEAKSLFPQARRALMIPPTDATQKTMEALRSDFERIADLYGPCDMVLADLDAGTPDQRIVDLIRLCESISASREALF